MSTEPLTLGQLSIWRDIEGVPRHRRHEPNLTQVWPVPAGTSVTTVRGALRELQRRHESLRTTYRLVPSGESGQQVHDIGATTVPLSTDADGGDDATLIRRHGRRAFHLGREPGWQAVLAGSGEQRRLVLSAHHIVTDGIGLLRLRDDFRRALREPLPEGSTGPAALARFEHSPAGRRRTDAAAEHWDRQAANSAPAPADLAAPLVEATLKCAATAVAARRLAERERTSVAAVLLAAYCSALAASGRDERTMVRIMSSNRFDDRRENVVTSMNQWVWLVLADSAELELPELINRVGGRAMRAYRHGVYDIDRLRRTLARAGFGAGQYDSSCSFNFISVAAAPSGTVVPAPLDDGLITWSAAPSSVGPRWYLRAIEDRHVTMILRIPAGPVASTTAAAILDGIRQRVIDAAARAA